MKILICEDEEILISAMEFRLRRLGLEPVFFTDVSKAAKSLISDAYSLIVWDIHCMNPEELDFVKYIREEHNIVCPVILIGEMERENSILEWMQRGANDFVLKPFKPLELAMRTQRLLQRSP